MAKVWTNVYDDDEVNDLVVKVDEIDKFHYRKQLRKKIHQREEILLKSRIKQFKKSNTNDQQSNLCGRKRKVYSEMDWNIMEDRFQYYNMLDIEQNTNYHLCFDDLMDAINFIELAILNRHPDAGMYLPPLLNTEKLKRFYLKLEGNDKNLNWEKEVKLVQLRVYRFLLRDSYLEKNLDESFEKCSKDNSLVECIFNLEQMKDMGQSDFDDIYFLNGIIEETSAFHVLDLFLKRGYYFDYAEDLLTQRAVYNIENSKLFVESCIYFVNYDVPIPETMNFDMLLKQLKDLDLDLCHDCDPFIQILCRSLKNLNYSQLIEAINNGLVDVVYKLEFTYIDKIRFITGIFNIDFMEALKIPLFNECLTDVPDCSDDINSDDDNYSSYESPKAEMFGLLTDMIHRTKDIELVLKLFTKEFFNFIYKNYEECQHLEYNNPIELLPNILYILKNYEEKTSEIENENEMIILWINEILM